RPAVEPERGLSISAFHFCTHLQRFSGIPAEGIKASDVGLDRCSCKLHRPLLLHGWLIITMFCEGIIIAKLSTCDSGICRCKVTEIKKKKN
ncbi:hypothetical protein PO909_021335, partial [Leuciscus waleckii]